jgi:hypothetical protein
MSHSYLDIYISSVRRKEPHVSALAWLPVKIEVPNCE